MSLEEAIELMEELKHEIKTYGEIKLWAQEDIIEAINVLCATVEELM